MKTDPNDTAFPVSENNGLTGLTKREYYTAMALQGILANSHENMYNISIKDTVKLAIALADSSIELLNEQP